MFLKAIWFGILYHTAPYHFYQSSNFDDMHMFSNATLIDTVPFLWPTSVGIYIFGSVGSGKSLLMDMFYSTVSQQNNLPRMRRMHFNSAMLEVRSVAIG